MTLPNFLILGECKCGTTSLYYDLIQHPRINRAIGNQESRETRDGQTLGEKEIRFFDKSYFKGLSWYKSCFPKLGSGEITGEASPTYLYRTQALQRIYNTFGNDIKLIVCLRNPVERLISHYSHIKEIVDKWSIRYPTFESFWESVQEHDYYIIEKGIYWKSLYMLYEYFNPEIIKVIKSEDLFDHTQKTCTDIFKFLGLEDAHVRQQKLRSTTIDKKTIHPNIIKEITEFYAPFNEKLNEFGLDIKW